MKDENRLFHLTLGECALLLCIIGIETKERYSDDYDMVYHTRGFSGQPVYHYPSSEESLFYLERGYWKYQEDNSESEDTDAEDGFCQLTFF